MELLTMYAVSVAAFATVMLTIIFDMWLAIQADQRKAARQGHQPTTPVNTENPPKGGSGVMTTKA